MKDSIIMFFDKEPKSLIISLINKRNYRHEWSKYICLPYDEEEYIHMEIPGKLDCAIIPLHPLSRTCININKEYVKIHTIQPETVLIQEIQECKNNKNLSIICEYDD